MIVNAFGKWDTLCHIFRGGVAGITTHTLNVLRNTIVKQAKRVSQLLSGHVFEGQCKYQLT